MLDMNNENRKGMYSHSERLRIENNAKGRAYSEQFALEQRAFVNSMVDFSRSFRARLPAGDVKPWEHLAVMGYEAYFAEWYRLTKKFADWEGLCDFFVSDYFYELPATKISSQLYATLVTDNRPIEHGDSMDVKHLSLAIPMAHFVLTDRKMANRIADLGIDEEWNALVFSESSIESLFEKLEEIGRSWSAKRPTNGATTAAATPSLGGQPTPAPPRPRLPHPSRFSADGRYERWRNE